MERLQSHETMDARPLKTPQSPHGLQEFPSDSEMVGFIPVLEILCVRETGVAVKVVEALLAREGWEGG